MHAARCCLARRHPLLTLLPRPLGVMRCHAQRLAPATQHLHGLVTVATRVGAPSAHIRMPYFFNMSVGCEAVVCVSVS